MIFKKTPKKYVGEVINIKDDEAYDVYIGRPSKYGNPFSHKEKTTAKYKVSSRAEAVEKYREWILEGEGMYLLNNIEELRGKVLGCWCKPKKCHGDVLIEILKNKVT